MPVITAQLLDSITSVASDRAFLAMFPGLIGAHTDSLVISGDYNGWSHKFRQLTNTVVDSHGRIVYYNGVDRYGHIDWLDDGGRIERTYNVHSSALICTRIYNERGCPVLLCTQYNTTLWRYDAGGRIVSVGEYPGGRTSHYIYNEDGSYTVQRNSGPDLVYNSRHQVLDNGCWHYTYNEDGRLLRQCRVHNSSDEHCSSSDEWYHTYSDEGLPLRAVDRSGGVLWCYTYNSQGQELSYYDYVASYSRCSGYDARGNKIYYREQSEYSDEQVYYEYNDNNVCTRVSCGSIEYGTAVLPDDSTLLAVLDDKIVVFSVAVKH